MTYKVIPLFAVPLYKSTIPDIDVLTYKKLISFEWEHNEGFVTHTETAERHLLNRPEFSGLKKALQSKVDEYVYEVLGVQKDLSWDITTSWVNRSKPGDYHTEHWHSNSMVSGVFYIDTNPNSGAILFHKDRSHRNLWSDQIAINFDDENDFNSQAVGVLPNKNEVLLFPSLLNHSVLQNTSNQDRYSLAFNAFPRGILGKGGNSELTV